MLRILLVVEDYAEMVFLETLLKKLGFDVDGTQNPRSLNDEILKMNPDILVMTAYGKRVNGFELALSLRRARGIPKVVLLYPSGTPNSKSPQIEAWVESPISAAEFLKVLSEVGNINLEQLEEKYKKLKMSLPKEEDVRTLKTPAAPGESLEKSEGKVGNLTPSTLDSKARNERYKKFLGDRPKDAAFDRKMIEENVKELRKADGGKSLEDLEKERKAFVKLLFGDD